MPEETSPFAAAATTAPVEAPATDGSAAPDMGDTSYLDSVASREPLLKSGVYPGVINSFEIKQSQSGDDYISIAAQVYGENMVNTEGQPVSPGKRLTTSIFPFSKAEKEKVDRKGRDLRNLLLALHDVPLDGNESKVYLTWPATQKPGVLKPKAMPDGSQRIAWSLHPFRPTDQWVGSRVLLQVRTGTDMDGDPRNEFTLLAASTKPVERKGRS